MIARPGIGWQTLLADLSLILFMVSAAAISRDGQHAAAAEPAGPSPRSEPLAVYRVGRGAPPLGEWLSTQPGDPRQMLTIVAAYRPGRMEASVAQAAQLAREAATRGIATRIVVEPGDGPTAATLAFDNTTATLARALHPAEGTILPQVPQGALP